MEDVAAWREEQLTEIKELKDDVSKWRTELKKEARAWRDATLRDYYGWRRTVEDEISTIKEEVKNGYKGIAGESASPEDLLGPSTGESDQAEADDTPGRKGRGRSSGSK